MTQIMLDEARSKLRFYSEAIKTVVRNDAHVRRNEHFDHLVTCYTDWLRIVKMLEKMQKD